MSASKLLGLAAVLLTLAGCGGGSDEEGTPDNPLSSQVDPIFQGPECHGIGNECAEGLMCAARTLDGRIDEARCVDPQRVCRMLGCPDSCIFRLSNPATIGCSN